jgi:hypothetical protein
MAKVVAIHGIAQQIKGGHWLHSEWLPALRDGLERAGAALPNGDDLACAFYGDLFRPSGGKALGFAWEAEDVEDPWEQEMLRLWWEAAAAADAGVPPPIAGGKARTPRLAQRALEALSQWRFFAALGERALIGNLKQVRAYLDDDSVRAYAQAQVGKLADDGTRVLIGHSLGSVVAYEFLCAHPELPVHTLVTLGSPLGIRNLIFERLRPAPVDGKGAWPGGVAHWVNVADRGDVVALTKALASLFHGAVEDCLVHNDADAHDVKPYLTAVETGRAIARGLAA